MLLLLAGEMPARSRSAAALTAGQHAALDLAGLVASQLQVLRGRLLLPVVCIGAHALLPSSSSHPRSGASYTRRRSHALSSGLTRRNSPIRPARKAVAGFGMGQFWLVKRSPT